MATNELQKRHYSIKSILTIILLCCNVVSTKFMKKHLSEICQIQLGYSFRSKLERSTADNCFKVIQMKDINENGALDTADLFEVEIKYVKQGFLVNKGDILFKSRGNINNAALIGEEIGKVIAAAPLMVLKIKRHNLLPEYLMWYINQPTAQKQLESKAGGTSVRMINIADLGDLVVDVPPLDAQKKIVAFAELIKKEEAILKELSNKRKKLYDAVLMKSATIKERK